MESIYYVLSYVCHRRCNHCYEDRFRPYHGADLADQVGRAAADFPTAQEIGRDRFAAGDHRVDFSIKRMIGGGETPVEWNVLMATAVLAMLPPGLVILLMQKWFVKGLVDTEK